MGLHFVNPVLSSRRALQQATGLENVPRTLGVSRTSRGARSESAGHVFDPEGWRPNLEEVAVPASLWVSLWTGRKPTQRTFEMVCLSFQGCARAEELNRHIESLKNVA